MTRGSFREVSYRHVIVNRVLGVGGGGGVHPYCITLHYMIFSISANKVSGWMKCALRYSLSQDGQKM